MPSKFCPYCEKKTPSKNFCVHCGHKLSNTFICPFCNTIIPFNTTLCPSCRHDYSLTDLDSSLKSSLRLNSVFTNFKPGILVMFLLSGYSLTQMMIGSILVFILPNSSFTDPINFALLSLIILLVSNTILIVVLWKWKSFTYQPPPLKRTQFSLIFLLLLILLVSISVIEVVVTIISFGLDLIHIDPTLTSPYDEYFGSPLNLLVFTILITIFGPIFEELIFRRYTISIMLNQCQSKLLAVCTSALIFSLSHTPTNVRISVRYAILHLTATFILGIILGIIFLRWGLKHAILFHSFWNIYSLIVQLLINDGATQLVDLMLLFFMIGTVILILSLLLRFRRFISHKPKINFPSRTIFSLNFKNILLIITYELIIPLILFSVPPSILNAALTFLYQFCAFLVGIILLDKEHERKKRFNSNQLDLDAFYDDISSLK